MSAPLLQLDIQAKQFARRLVLDRVSLSLAAGELVSLVGPSGCGKSTLLRIIAGLDRDYQGQAQILGEPIRLHSRHVGVVFQEPRLLPWLSVADNVGFELGRRGGRHPRVAELLADVGLADWGHAYPKQLSGGMAQRVAIARGLFTRPALLLLDEPFSAVDAFTRMRLQDVLLAAASHSQASVLLVTHDVNEAAYLSDRVLVLGRNPGRIRGEVRVDWPHPRQRGDARLARAEAEILALLDDREDAPQPPPQAAPWPASLARLRLAV